MIGRGCPDAISIQRTSGAMAGDDVNECAVQVADSSSGGRLSDSGEKLERKCRASPDSQSSTTRQSSTRGSASAKKRLKRLQTLDELTAQRASANLRERDRTRQLNDAFTLLRKHVPTMPSDKMSKIHTLKIASDYIRFLDDLMSPDDKLFGYEIRLQYDEHGNVNLAPLFNLWRGGMGRSASSDSRLNDPSDDFAYDYQPFALDRNSKQIIHYIITALDALRLTDDVERLAERRWVTVRRRGRAAGSKRRAAAGRWEPDGGGRKLDSAAAKTTLAVLDGWRFGETDCL
uniref:BHLH domain-containing protein n=1 Tax=Plectus sambesii TaxID=2011161 RepID=A0A914XEJ5_9BILA